MTLSREEFNRQCVKLYIQCQELADIWNISKKLPNSQIVELSDHELDQVDHVHDNLILGKIEQRVAINKSRVETHEFSVIYSESYEVPVMYFRRSDQSKSIQSGWKKFDIRLIT